MLNLIQTKHHYGQEYNFRKLPQNRPRRQDILMEVYRYDDTIIYEYNLSNIDTRVLSEEEFNDCIKSCTAEMKQMKPILTQNWAELYLLGLKDEACSDIVQYVECGMNVAYHFRDSNGIRLYTIKISNSEIWDAIEKKQTY